MGFETLENDLKSEARLKRFLKSDYSLRKRRISLGP